MKKIFTIVPVLFVLVACATSGTDAASTEAKAEKVAPTADYRIEYDTLVFIPSWFKNKTEAKPYASYHIEVSERASGYVIKEYDLGIHNGYALIKGLPEGEYMITHVKAKILSGITFDKPLMMQDMDTAFPFDVVDDAITVTRDVFLTTQTQKAGVDALLLHHEPRNGDIQIQELKRFLEENPRYHKLVQPEILIGVEWTEEDPDSITRFFWNTVDDSKSVRSSSTIGGFNFD